MRQAERVARQPRMELADCVHHVTTRGPTELDPFVDDEAREQLLGGVGKVAGEYGWTALAYSVLTSRYHLVVHVTDESLGVGMLKLHARYARWLNRLLDRRGRVWADRFGSRPVRSSRHLANAVVYVDLNAIDAGLAAAPGEWAWDSAGANTGIAPARAWHDPERARSAVGYGGHEAGRLYHDLLRARVSLGGHPSAGDRRSPLYDHDP
jgi:REP element-mobilizing transposase RayT